jgi:hypothetical protein
MILRSPLWTHQLRILLLLPLISVVLATEVHKNGVCAMRGQVSRLLDP